MASILPPAKRIKIPTQYSLTMMKQRIHEIRNGEKSIEGRIFERTIPKLKIGDRLRFYYMRNNKDDVLCEVKKIEKYKTFQEMLKNNDYKKCIPEAACLEEAVQIYNQIPKYPEKEKKYGVAAISLSVCL